MSTHSFNYSKWDNIELSDDESDLHPNIDKDSWFRMKHRTRLEREEKEDREVVQLQQKTAEDESRLKIINAKINNIQMKIDSKCGDKVNNNNNEDDEEDLEYDDIDALKIEKHEIELYIEQRTKRIYEINERRKWNIDNICKTKEEKTVVNTLKNTSLHADITNIDPIKMKMYEDKDNDKNLNTTTTTTTDVSSSANVNVFTKSNNTASVTASSSSSSPVSSSSSSLSPVSSSSSAITSRGSEPGEHIRRERLAVISYNDYVIGQEQVLESYSEIKDMELTKEYLFKHCDVLLHEHAQSYMLLSCLEDEMNGKKIRMKLVCRQSQILSHIQELGISMKRDPRDVILPFFKRLEEPMHAKGFDSAVEDFITRIQKRAIEKRKEMDLESKAEKAQNKASESYPKGPGGLDPLEVLESLPTELKEAFERQDIEGLQTVLSNMDPILAKDCMKRCVDSGLWVPKHKEIYEEGYEGDDGDVEEY